MGLGGGDYFDGGYVGDDSGDMPGGSFQVGQSYAGQPAIFAGLGSPLETLTEEVFNTYGINPNTQEKWLMSSGITWVTSTGDLVYAYFGPTYSVPATAPSGPAMNAPEQYAAPITRCRKRRR
jgi:hypothetical protein